MKNDAALLTQEQKKPFATIPHFIRRSGPEKNVLHQ